MKTTRTHLTIALLFLLMAFNSRTFAQTYNDAYICGTASATLVAQKLDGTTIATADLVYWNLTKADGSVVSYAAKPGNNANLDISGSDLTTGVNTFTASVKAFATSCLSDPATLTVYKLAVPTVTFSSVGSPYCTNATPAPSSTVVANVSPAPPAGIGYTYTWSASKLTAGNTSTPAIATVGTDNASTGLTNTFTMTATGVGVYSLTPTVNYVLLTGNTGKLKADASCNTTSASPASIEVYDKAAQPKVSVL